jgi:hypothetical protein
MFEHLLGVVFVARCNAPLTRFSFERSSGPASYHHDVKTSLSYLLDRQPLSHRGYTFNARTEKREVFLAKVDRLVDGSSTELCSSRLTFLVRPVTK